MLDYVDRLANASTATLPIALSVADAEGRLERDDLVLLAAFGGGLTWGATVMQWSARKPGARNDPPPAQPSVTPTV
jgi:3-oxoacyl-[acyl-carrier-protein] synthase-3